MSRERELEDALRKAYKRAGREAGYWGNYFNRDLRRLGALTTARKMLLPRPQSAGPHKGFQAIVDAGRSELLLESVVLRPQFASLFTPAEIAEAQRRLAAFPPEAARKDLPPDERFPDELKVPKKYQEGAAKRVTVNAYERDLKARAACLKKHGRACKVCGVDYSKLYGKVGERCLHVHHLRPLAAMRGGYRVDPAKDLIPVCPNCHAMLHSTSPPLSPIELSEIVAEAPRRNRSGRSRNA